MQDATAQVNTVTAELLYGVVKYPDEAAELHCCCELDVNNVSLLFVLEVELSSD